MYESTRKIYGKLVRLGVYDTALEAIVGHDLQLVRQFGFKDARGFTTAEGNPILNIIRGAYKSDEVCALIHFSPSELARLQSKPLRAATRGEELSSFAEQASHGLVPPPAVLRVPTAGRCRMPRRSRSSATTSRTGRGRTHGLPASASSRAWAAGPPSGPPGGGQGPRTTRCGDWAVVAPSG